VTRVKPNPFLNRRGQRVHYVRAVPQRPSSPMVDMGDPIAWSHEIQSDYRIDKRSDDVTMSGKFTVRAKSSP